MHSELHKVFSFHLLIQVIFTFKVKDLCLNLNYVTKQGGGRGRFEATRWGVGLYTNALTFDPATVPFFCAFAL